MERWKNKGKSLLTHIFSVQHNKQLCAFRSAALWPITLNAVGDHICHFVIDRLLFILQPSHRAVKKALRHTDSAQNMDQQRHLVFRRRPRPRTNPPIRNSCDVARRGLPVCPNRACILSLFLK